MELAAIPWAVSSALVGLQILSLNAHIAGTAQRAIQLVVMLSAVGSVIENVEVDCLKLHAAVATSKAFTMVFTGESAISRGHRFTNDSFTTTPTAAFGLPDGWTRRG